MTVSEDSAVSSATKEAAGSPRATHASRRRPSSSGALYGIDLSVEIWMVFANIAGHHDKAGALDATLREAVEAELASRRCPGLRLDPVSVREFARERRINHADLYQKRSLRLKAEILMPKVHARGELMGATIMGPSAAGTDRS
jgi:hypothetical protein